MNENKPHLSETRFWRWALLGIPFILIAAYFGTWSELDNIDSLALKVLIIAGETLIGYVGLALLLW